MAKNKDQQKPKPKQTKKDKIAPESVTESVTELATSTDTSIPTHDRAKAEELYSKGREFYKAGDIEKAEEAYLGSIESDPNIANAYNNLGVIYNNDENNTDKAIEYYKKAILLDPLDKLVVNNLIKSYNKKDDAESKKSAIQVQRDYEAAVQNSINKNTDDHKKVREDIDQISTKIENITENTDVKTLTDNLVVSNKALEGIQQDKASMDSMLADASKLLTVSKTHDLAQHFDKKTKELEIEKTGFEGKFKGMIGWSILFLVVAIGFNIWLSIYKSLSIIDSTIQGMVITTPIMILLLWLTKYYNRRLHETIHLIEEYKHKSIVLYSFTAYSTQLKILGGDDKTPLLDYTQKVSSTINQSPTHALTRKKTDKIPTSEIVELLNAMHPLRYNNNNDNNTKN